MRYLLKAAILLILFAWLLGQIGRAETGIEVGPTSPALWKSSVAVAVTGHSLDLASSWGKVEANPMLRRGHRVGYTVAGIKMGTVAGGLVLQHRLIRKYPKLKKVFAVANYISGGVAAAISIRNSR